MPTLHLLITQVRLDAPWLLREPNVHLNATRYRQSQINNHMNLYAATMKGILASEKARRRRLLKQMTDAALRKKREPTPCQLTDASLAILQQSHLPRHEGT